MNNAPERGNDKNVKIPIIRPMISNFSAAAPKRNPNETAKADNKIHPKMTCSKSCGHDIFSRKISPPNKMINENVEYEEVLKEAQKLGYAEADPTFDVGGFDTAHKLLILGSIAYGIDVKPEEVLIEGIQNISKIDIEFAKEFKYSIKLLAIAKKIKNEIELRVHPVLIPQEKMISKIDGVMNGISLIGDKVGETMFYGAGAGANATASAVVANIIDIARRGKGSPMLGFEKQVGTKPTLMPKENIKTKYYLRLEVADKSGTLAKIATIFGNNDISIENMMQRVKENEKANLLLTTHTCIEKDILKAIDGLKHSKVVLTSPVMIRIED